MFRSETQRDGQKYFFITNDEGVFIQHVFEDFFGHFPIKFSVSPLGDDWYRVEITAPAQTQDQSLGEALMDIDSLLRGDKGFYACRAEGYDEAACMHWFEVKHLGGPYA